MPHRAALLTKAAQEIGLCNPLAKPALTNQTATRRHLRYPISVDQNACDGDKPRHAGTDRRHHRLLRADALQHRVSTDVGSLAL